MQAAAGLPVTEADVVVIGAGAFGLATAYQLAKHGAGRVAVLDKFAPGTQSSARAAGLFKLIQADATLTQLARRSLAIVAALPAETGLPVPLVASGSIRMARTAVHAAMLEAEAGFSRDHGVELELVDQATLRRLAPYLTGNGVTAACWVPGDRYLEHPPDLLHAYAAGATARGAVVVGETPVTGIRLERGQVTGVVTPRGEIATARVVNAAGAWAPGIGALVGSRVPVATVRHQLHITTPLAGIAPTDPIVRVTDAGAYLRPARGGLMAGRFEPKPLPIDPRRQPAGFSMDDVPIATDVLAEADTSLADQVPTLPAQPTAEERGGLFTMSPDGQFLAGPVPGVAGFWLATGCNGSGFSMASAIGEALAAWILTGAPPLDLSPLDPRRFAGTTLTDDELLAAGVWQYANYYTPRASKGATPL